MERATLKERRTRYLALLDEELPRWVELLRQRGATLVLLFGSHARGQAGLLGDVDLIVVMPSPQGILERTAELYRLLAARVDLDLIAYTPEEFERMRNHAFIQRALREGRVLYEAAP